MTPPAIPAGRLRDLAQPTLTAGDLVLRPWEAADADAVCAAYDDPGIQRWHDRTMDLAEATVWVAAWADRWRDETDAGWAVVDDGVVAGQISLRSLGYADGDAWVSYWVAPHARGRRTAATALTAVSTWGFDTLGLHRIEVDHSVDNVPSCRVATRAGFRLEGTKRGAALHADGWHDMHLHARVRGDGALS